MTKLESIREEVKQLLGEEAFKRLSVVINECEVPTKIEYKMWQRVLDEDKSLFVSKIKNNSK